MEQKFFICKTCGNIIAMVKESGVPVECCGEPMVELVAGTVDAAREILLRDLRARAETARSGEEISVEDRIASRRGQSFATSLALRAAEALNASTGGQGLDLSNPVQRAWRDVNAVSRHISLNWDAVGSMAGQLALGLEPKGQY